MSGDPFAVTGHRPWPMPSAPWIMRQTWVDLLFIHWAVPADAVRPLVPERLELETYDGSAWIGVVPFLLTGFRLRPAPPVPGLSEFPELNVRTYVRFDRKPGVYFFSLDAACRLAVTGALRLFRLPYFFADMDMAHRDGTIQFRSRRRQAPPAEFEARYAPTGEAAPPEPGSLDAFLTERYCLYAVSPRRNGYRADIHHPPWQLQPAECEVRRNTMVEVLGLKIPTTPPILHLSRRQDMVNWAPVRVFDGR
jgi:uncharacterized protein